MTGNSDNQLPPISALKNTLADNTTYKNTNIAWFDRAKHVIPGGVDSPVRSFNSVGGTPVTVAKGQGAYLFDVEGNRYVDLIQSYGAIIMGHADPDTLDAIRNAMSRGTTFGAPTTGEVLLAEEICSRVPGCNLIRFVSSGTEAAMSAVRLARGYTGRSRVIKFAGCYHGHSDGLLAAGGSGIATIGLPDSAGVPPSSVNDTIICPYNQVPPPDILDENIACVIVEPIAANMGVVPPVPGFLEGLRKACNSVGALLIFDEVITGFRIAYSNATALCEVTPDLYCFGKIIGGGLPLAAFGGRSDIFSMLAPEGPVYQAGTLSGNPLATAAGLSVLRRLNRDAYSRLQAKVKQFATELQSCFVAAGTKAWVSQYGTLCSIFFGAGSEVHNYEESRIAASTVTSDGTGMYAAFFHRMLKQGVMLAPGPYEAMFIGMAHSDSDLEYILNAAKKASSGLCAA